jgi:hypothetical protein
MLVRWLERRFVRRWERWSLRWLVVSGLVCGLISGCREWRGATQRNVTQRNAEARLRQRTPPTQQAIYRRHSASRVRHSDCLRVYCSQGPLDILQLQSTLGKEGEIECGTTSIRTRA